MATYRVTFGNASTEDIEATYYKDEKSFIDFYADSEDEVTADRVLRIQASSVRRIELVREDSAEPNS